MKVVWITPYTSAKLWDPALRLRRWNVHKELLIMGVDSNFLFDAYNNPDAVVESYTQNADIVVFTEHSEWDLRWMQKLSAQGKILLRDHCELLFGFPMQKETFALANMVVCSSDVVFGATLAQGYQQLGNVCCIPDMWEDASIQPVRDTSDNLTAVFMGTGVPVDILLRSLGDLVRAEGYDLNMITDRPGVGIAWGKDTWQKEFAGADIAICPQDPNMFPGKSSVKVAQALSFGYPVIASPIPSYESIAKGGGVLLARDRDDWSRQLRGLRSPEARYRKHVEAVRNSINYAPGTIARMWYAQFSELLAARRSI